MNKAWVAHTYLPSPLIFPGIWKFSMKCPGLPVVLMYQISWGSGGGGGGGGGVRLKQCKIKSPQISSF